jgi:hypothetical protein
MESRRDPKHDYRRIPDRRVGFPDPRPATRGRVRCPRRWPAHLRLPVAAPHPHPDPLDRPSRVAENETIPDSDVTFGEILLRPSNSKSIKALTKFSNEMARQPTVGLDALLNARVVQDVPDKLDDALLKRDGCSRP